MREVPATEFSRNFGLYREVAQREPVAVTSRGRTTGYFVSAVEYEDLQRYKALARRSRSLFDLNEAEMRAMTDGKMASEHDHLNKLLEAK